MTIPLTTEPITNPHWHEPGHGQKCEVPIAEENWRAANNWHCRNQKGVDSGRAGGGGSKKEPVTTGNTTSKTCQENNK